MANWRDVSDTGVIYYYILVLDLVKIHDCWWGNIFAECKTTIGRQSKNFLEISV
jgi:hypothetical protein